MPGTLYALRTLSLELLVIAPVALRAPHICRRGYAERGLRTVTPDSHHIRGERFSIIPLLSATEVLDYIIVKHTGVADIFLKYIKLVVVRSHSCVRGSICVFLYYRPRCACRLCSFVC